MSEQHYFADVTLPFHVWVRERAGARGFRWVLRNASEKLDTMSAEAANDSGEGPPRQGG